MVVSSFPTLPRCVIRVTNNADQVEVPNLAADLPPTTRQFVLVFLDLENPHQVRVPRTVASRLAWY